MWDALVLIFSHSGFMLKTINLMPTLHITGMKSSKFNICFIAIFSKFSVFAHMMVE